MKPARVSTPSDTDVLVRRSFAAPVAKVWRAYTEPALMQRWLLGPPGWSFPVCEMDVRVGGTFKWRWKNNESGDMFGFHGEFREVTPERRMVHTEYFDPGDVGGDMGEGALVTVDMTEENGKTTVSSLISYASKADRDAAMATGMTDGMEMSYVGLDELLASEPG